MTQATDTEAIELSIVACTGCDQLFLLSPRRQACPTCGSPAAVTLFEFEAGPSGVQLKGSILDVQDGAGPPEERESAETASSDSALSASSEALGEPISKGTPLTLESMAGFYLMDEGVTEHELRDAFLAAGAEPEPAIVAVGRLAAVHEFLQDLHAAGIPADVSAHAQAPDPKPDLNQPAAEIPAGGIDNA